MNSCRRARDNGKDRGFGLLHINPQLALTSLCDVSRNIKGSETLKMKLRLLTTLLRIIVKIKLHEIVHKALHTRSVLHQGFNKC